MADILTIEDARNAIRVPDNDTSKDTQLEQTYIPATTAVVEDLIGPVMESTRTFVADGGTAAVVLPVTGVTEVSSVTDSGAVLDTTGYTADLASGIVYRGSQTATIDYTAGRRTVLIEYVAGAYTAPEDVPANIRLAARTILAHLWQADQQGFRPDFGGPDNSVVTSPSGYAVPRRAVELLGRAATVLPGIA